jgi:hypothetical protein
MYGSLNGRRCKTAVRRGSSIELPDRLFSSRYLLHGVRPLGTTLTLTLPSDDQLRMNTADNDNTAPEPLTEGLGVGVPPLDKSQNDSINRAAFELIASDPPEENRPDPVGNTATEILASEPPQEQRYDSLRKTALDVILRDS